MNEWNDEMELNSVAEAIDADGYHVGAVRIKQAIREIQRLEDVQTSIRAYCTKAKIDGFQHVTISTILALLEGKS